MGTRANSVALGLRISTKADQDLRELSSRLGISKTAVLEVLIRERARAERINPHDAFESLAEIERSVDHASRMQRIKEFKEKIAKFPNIGSLAPGADSREAIYGDHD